MRRGIAAQSFKFWEAPHWKPPRWLGHQLVDLPLGPLAGRPIEIISSEFASCIDPAATVERLWTGGRWTEGPAWLPRERILVWSDIPGDRLLRWRELDRDIAVFRSPCSAANGGETAATAEDGSSPCEQNSRRITRTEADGHITVVADRYGGKRFTSPNDVVVKSDGSVWFLPIPPTAAAASALRGQGRARGLPRISCRSGVTNEVRQMTNDMVMPSGLAFSLDEKLLYVVDLRQCASSRRPQPHPECFSVGENDVLASSGVLVSDESKALDGLSRLDREGRIWAGAGEGVRCYRPDGALIGRIRLPERVANLEFAGADRSRLFICGTTSVYVVGTKTLSRAFNRSSLRHVPPSAGRSAPVVAMRELQLHLRLQLLQLRWRQMLRSH